jgi:two-component system, NarL family, sensor histidine kinase EvgS
MCDTTFAKWTVRVSAWAQGLGGCASGHVLRCLLGIGLAGAGLWAATAAAQAHAQAAPAALSAPAAKVFRDTAPSLPLNANALLTPDEQALVARLPVLRVAVTLPPPEPYEQISAQGEVSGIHPEMLVSLGKALGLRFTPLSYPTQRDALKAAQRGEVDLLMTLAPTRERLGYLAFTLGATPQPGALFGRLGAAESAPEQALFALPRESVAVEHVRRLYPKARIDLVDHAAEALQRVAQGTADLYLGGLLETAETLARERLQSVVPVVRVNFGTGYHHFAVRKELSGLVPVLNKGIQSLRSQPSDQLTAALAGVPPTLQPLKPLALTEQEAGTLLARPTWRVGAVRGLRMLNEVAENGLHSGIASEYIEQIARRLGVATEVVGYDSVAGMLNALREGDIDLVPFLTRTPEREQTLAFSKPYLEMPYMLVTRSDGPLLWGIPSLAGRKLALALEHPLREIIARDHPSVKVLDAANGNEAMDMVALGDADAAVEIKLFANLRINSDPTQQLRLSSVVSELPAQFHVAVRKDAPELLALVDRALADIPADERQRMLWRWVAIDLQPVFPWRRYLPLMWVSGLALLMLVGVTAWWMRRLHTEVAARRSSEGLLRDIASTAPGSVFRYVIGRNGRLKEVYLSPSTKALLGFDPPHDRSLLNSLSPHLDKAERDAAREQERASLKSGAPFKATLHYRYPGMPPRWLLAHSSLTSGPEGEQVWTGSLVDVSTERELQARLAREAEARNLLLATASHELRAPTHNLSLALQSIDAAALDEAARTSMRIARRSAHTLTQLLNDVLDVARLEAGPIPIRPQTFDLREMVEALAEAWGASAREKGLGFSLEVDSNVPHTLTHDALRINQVLANLLSNAYKYTSRGMLGLSVRVQGAELVFEVRDTGPGLDEAERKRLFQPFVTLQNGEFGASPIGSSGLGLLVSRQIAERLGGRLCVASTPGEGSRFAFHLPLDGAALADAAGAPAVAGKLSSAPVPPAVAPVAPRVVVCDDDPVSRLLSAQILRLRGYQVIEAADGPSAVAHCRDHEVRALITDLDMPGLSGLDVIRQVRAHEATVTAQGGDPERPRLAVVVCSGSPVPDAAEPPLHDAYLLKPVQIETLSRTLESLGVASQRGALVGSDA